MKFTKNQKTIGLVIILGAIAWQLGLFTGMFATSESFVLQGGQISYDYRELCGPYGASNFDPGDVCEDASMRVVWTCGGQTLRTLNVNMGNVQKGQYIHMSGTVSISTTAPTGWCSASETVYADGKVLVSRTFPSEFLIQAAPDECNEITRSCPDGSIIVTAECVNNELVQTGRECSVTCGPSDYSCTSWGPCENGWSRRECDIKSSAVCYGGDLGIGQPYEVTSCTADTPDDTPDVDTGAGSSGTSLKVSCWRVPVSDSAECFQVDDLDSCMNELDDYNFKAECEASREVSPVTGDDDDQEVIEQAPVYCFQYNPESGVYGNECAEITSPTSGYTCKAAMDACDEALQKLRDADTDGNNVVSEDELTGAGITTEDIVKDEEEPYDFGMIAFWGILIVGGIVVALKMFRR